MSVITNPNTKHRLPTHQQGISIIALLGYLASLIIVGGLVFLAIIFVILEVTGKEDPHTNILLAIWTVVMALWTWLYFWVVGKRKKKEEFDFGPGRDKNQEAGLLDRQPIEREASDSMESSEVKRKKERRKDNIRSVPLLLNFFPMAILGAIVIPTAAWSILGIIRFIFPAAPDAIAWGLMVLGFAFGSQWFAQWRARRLMFKASTGRMVLWLRRFHEDGFFPFELFLEDTLTGIALPITVQDTTVAGSDVASTMNPKILAPATITFSIILSTMALLMTGTGPMVLLVAVPLLIISGIWALRVKRAAATNDLRTEDGRERIDNLMRLLDSDEKIPNALTLFRMSDKNWKEWVGDFIERADVIVMDITHLTESLGWEVATCKKYIEPGQLILACGKYDDTLGDPWPPLITKLEEMVGPEFVAGCQRFTYDRPRKKPMLEKIQSGQRVVRARRQRAIHEAGFLEMVDRAFASKDSSR